MSGSSTCLRPLCWTTVNAQEALQSTACWNGGLTPRPLETRSAPPVFKCEILCDYIKKLKSLLTTILLDHFPFFIFPFYLLFGLTNTAWYRTFFFLIGQSRAIVLQIVNVLLLGVVYILGLYCPKLDLELAC